MKYFAPGTKYEIKFALCARRHISYAQRISYCAAVFHLTEGQISLKKPHCVCNAVFSGAASQIRTGDLILTKDALYLLSYSSKDSLIIIS